MEFGFMGLSLRMLDARKVITFFDAFSVLYRSFEKFVRLRIEIKIEENDQSKHNKIMVYRILLYLIVFIQY